MSKKNIKELLEKAQHAPLSPKEQIELEYWLHHLHEDDELNLTDADLLNVRKSMWEAIDPGKTKQIQHGSYKWARVLAAASVVLITGSILIYSLNFRHHKQVPATAQILPGSNKAFLILGNGEKIVLSGKGQGQLRKSASISIFKSNDSTVVYHLPGGEANGNVSNNTLSTPKGGQYSLILADGTKVTLNAESSLSFPEKFTGTERRVVLSGEAYFEVAHNEKMPFHVNSGGQDVQVLGTHFNISAYPDESTVKTTLIEGKVKIKTRQDSAILKPGDQAALHGDLKVSPVNVDDVIAWKNGYFRFDDDKFEDIMKVLSRWYNVKYVFKDESLKHSIFGGVTNRFSRIDAILNLMETAGLAHFEIEGDTIIITRKKQPK